MKILKTENQEVRYIESIVCDCCKRKIVASEDPLGFQEIWSITKVGGYGSAFGDGSVLRIDLCDVCVKKLLGEYINIEPSVIIG